MDVFSRLVVVGKALLQHGAHHLHHLVGISFEGLLADSFTNETEALERLATQSPVFLVPLGLDHLFQQGHDVLVVRDEEFLGEFADHGDRGQAIFLHGARRSLLQPREELRDETVVVFLEMVRIEPLTETDEGRDGFRRHTDVDVVDARNDGVKQGLAVIVLHIRFVIVGELTNRDEAHEAHSRVWMVQVLYDVLHALIHPGLFFDVLYNLNHGHDARTRVFPARGEGLTEEADHLEEHRHEHVLEFPDPVHFRRGFLAESVQLSALLRQPVQVLLSYLHGSTVHFIVVVLVHRGRPSILILLHLQHPLNVQADDLLQQRLPLGLAEVFCQTRDEGHGRFHGAVPDVRRREGLVPTQRYQRPPQLLQTVGFEELWLLISSVDQGAQDFLEVLLVLIVCAEALDGSNNSWHGGNEHLGVLGFYVLDKTQHEPDTGSADLWRRAAHTLLKSLNESSSLGHQTISQGTCELLENHQSCALGCGIVDGDELRKCRQESWPSLVDLVEIGAHTLGDGCDRLAQVSPQGSASLVAENSKQSTLHPFVCCRLQVLPQGVPPTNATHVRPEHDGSGLAQLHGRRCLSDTRDEGSDELVRRSLRRFFQLLLRTFDRFCIVGLRQAEPLANALRRHVAGSNRRHAVQVHTRLLSH
mmetsp:Transcript_748/g.2085  ORF Transcript_748/g.2085 Transcript_748/m.2085 type:complete len:645 (-) Transcript_748:16-1950(-)